MSLSPPTSPSSDTIVVGIAAVYRTKYDTDAADATPRRPTHYILITKRRAGTVYGGYWELPGGKAEPEESPGDCALRELHEEVGVRATIEAALGVVEHTYAHGRVRLHPFLCREAEGSAQAQPLHVAEIKWCPLDELAQHQFPEANAPIVDEITRVLKGKP